MIRAIKPEVVIHCGDIVTPSSLNEFEGLPIQFILGNSDFDVEGLNKTSFSLGFGPIGKELEIQLAGKSIYVHHGHKEYLIDEQAGAQLYDYVFHGHTHETRDERLGKTRIINPGALSSTPQYTFASLNLATDELRFNEIPRGLS